MKKLLLILTTIFSLLGHAEEDSNRVFALGGVLPIGDTGELVYIGPECKEIYLFTSQWEVDQDYSFAELDWKVSITGTTKVKTPVSRYHISLVPQEIEASKRDSYIQQVEEYLDAKVLAEGKRVKAGEVDAEETLYYGKCRKTPMNIKLIPRYAMGAKFGLRIFADSFQKNVYLTERYGKPVVELDVEVNPLEDKGRVHKLVSGNLIGEYLEVDAKSSSMEVMMEGFLKGSYEAFSEFDRKTYQEKTCWTTRSCRKFGPFKYSCRTHHHCRYYPVVKILFKEMSVSSKAEIVLTSSDSFSEAEKDQFRESLLNKFIMTNFNGEVSSHNDNLIVYRGGALKRKAEVKQVVAQRILDYTDKNSSLRPLFDSSGALESREIDRFIESEQYKCLLDKGLESVSENGPCN